MSPTPVPGVGLVVVAAGRGERLGAGRPKALVQVGGRALLVWALEGAAAAGLSDVVVVAPPDALDEVRALAPGAVVVAGGATRQASVAAGLAALPPGDLVLVHDAARAFVPPAGLRRRGRGPACRRACGGPGRRRRPTPCGTSTTARSTARGWWPCRPRRASAATCSSARTRPVAPRPPTTPGSSRRSACRCRWCQGSEEAFKVTRPLDVVLAEALLRSRSGS